MVTDWAVRYLLRLPPNYHPMVAYSRLIQGLQCHQKMVFLVGVGMRSELHFGPMIAAVGSKLLVQEQMGPAFPRRWLIAEHPRD